MSAALQDFLKSEFSGNVKQIDHKYSEAGHGEVQKVDNVHSVTETFIRHKFLYSPAYYQRVRQNTKWETEL